MAVTLQRAKIAANLQTIVDGSIIAVKAERSRSQAKKEAEFQKAIANGMSYPEQIKFRETQLKEERESSFKDDGYLATLEKSVADTKKLGRFNAYRTKYSAALSELSGGKINEETYLLTLQNTLVGVDDPDLRLEIQNDITTAQNKVKDYKDTILSNQVKKAKFDGTAVALNDAVSRVSSARMLASISGNEDEVTAYDETLSALNAQLSTVRVQDSITDFQVHSATRGTNPIEKLNFINSEFANADPNIAIKIGDKSYANAQQFWQTERDNFLAGNSQVFGSFFKELTTDLNNNIATETTKFGHPTQQILDNTMKTLNELRVKTEVAPFLGQFDAVQSDIMSKAVDKFANSIVEIGTQNLDFANADAQIQNLESRYGVNLDARKVQLRNFNISASDELNARFGQSGAISRSISSDMVLPRVGTDGKPLITGTTSTAKDTSPAATVTTPSIVPPRESTTPTTETTQTDSAGTPEQSTTTTLTFPPTPNYTPATPPLNYTPAPAPVEAEPQYTPRAGVGTKSPGGTFVFTEQGWKPATSSVSTPTKTTPALNYTPAPTKATPTKPKMIAPAPPLNYTPANFTPAPPKESPPATRTLSEPVYSGNAPFAPATKEVMPNYTPAKGFGAVSNGGTYIYTKDGWKLK